MLAVSINEGTSEIISKLTIGFVRDAEIVTSIADPAPAAPTEETFHNPVDVTLVGAVVPPKAKVAWNGNAEALFVVPSIPDNFIKCL